MNRKDLWAYTRQFRRFRWLWLNWASKSFRKTNLTGTNSGASMTFTILFPLCWRRIDFVSCPGWSIERVKKENPKKGGALFYVTVDAEFDFVAASDGSKHTVKMIAEAMDRSDKATNKAMSAAYKYACFQTFCIPTEGDNDADFTRHMRSRRNQRNRSKRNNRNRSFGTEDLRPKRRKNLDRQSKAAPEPKNEIQRRSLRRFRT